MLNLICAKHLSLFVNMWTLDRKKLSLQLLDIFRVHLIKARFVHSAYGSELSNSQARMLDELERNPDWSLQQLGKLLSLDKSNLSRALKKLAALDYLALHSHTLDGRKLSIKLLKKALDFNQQQRQITEHFNTNNLQRFAKIEQKKFLRLFKAFVENSGATYPITRLSHESELTILWRKLTYMHGVITSNYLNSGFTALEWVVLSAIHYDPLGPGILSKIVGLPESSCNLMLSRLKKSGLVQAKPSSKDRRFVELKLSKFGKQELMSIEKKADQLLSATLNHFSVADRQQFVTLLAIYTECSAELGCKIDSKKHRSITNQGISQIGLVNKLV